MVGNKKPSVCPQTDRVSVRVACRRPVDFTLRLLAHGLVCLFVQMLLSVHDVNALEVFSHKLAVDVVLLAVGSLVGVDIVDACCGRLLGHNHFYLPFKKTSHAMIWCVTPIHGMTNKKAGAPWSVHPLVGNRWFDISRLPLSCLFSACRRLRSRRVCSHRAVALKP